MKRFSIVAFALALALAFSGCGGGGGGGGTVAKQTLDENNAVALAYDTEVALANALDTADMGHSIDIARAPVSFGGPAGLPVPSLLAEPARALTDALKGGGLARESFLARTINPVLTIPDRCGDGEMTISGTVTKTEAAYDLNVNVVFAGYDNCSAVIDGQFNVKLAVTAAATSATYTATNLSFDSPGKDGTLSGKITFDAVNEFWQPVSGEFGIDLTWTSGEEILKFAAIVITFDRQGLDYDNEVTLDGDLFFNNKKVTIATIEAIGFDQDAPHPSAGQYIVDGDGKLRVTYLSATELRIEVDPDESGDWLLAFEGTWEDFYDIAGYPETGEGAFALAQENVYATAYKVLNSEALAWNIPFAQPAFSASRAPVAGGALPGSAMEAMRAAFQLAEESSARVGPMAAVTITDQDRISVCGGSVRINGEFGVLLAEKRLIVDMVFTNFDTCEGFVLNGQMSLDGTENTDENTINSTFTLNNLNAYSSLVDQTTTMNGTVVYMGDYDLSQYTLTSNLSWTSGEDSVELEDFVVASDEVALPQVAVTVDGILEVNHRRLLISTPVEIVYDDITSSQVPDEGELLIDGEGQLTITFSEVEGTSMVQVALDANEDGDYDDPGDFDSGAVTWEDFYTAAGF